MQLHALHLSFQENKYKSWEISSDKLTQTKMDLLQPKN